MAAKYDIESLLADVLSILTTNLNTKISAITTEKGDSLPLATVPAAAYFCQTLNDGMANFDPFVFYGVGDIKPASGNWPGLTGQEVQVEVLICVKESNLTTGNAKQMFRYGRALKDIFDENFDQLDNGNVKPTVFSLMPIDIGIMNDSFTHKAVGVIIKASIG